MVITAPVDGYVTQLTAAKGDYAAVGQPLIMFVPRNVSVTVNFKETELRSVRVGPHRDASRSTPIRPHLQRPRRRHSGRQRTAFSSLPPKNATGNYVKIVKRVLVFNKRRTCCSGRACRSCPR